MFRYDRFCLQHDAVSALVVAVVLLPSALAYAELAHCSPAAGLYSAVAGMLAYAAISTSRHVIVGPDAAIALLVGAAIGPLSGGDPGKAAMLAGVLALLTAGVLLLMALLRLGVAADFLSSPALLGFLNGAAVVIIASQLGKLCGIALTEDNTLLRLWEWGTRLQSVHAPTLLAGLVCIAVLILCRWRLPRIPGAVVVFVLAVVAGRCVDLSQHGLQVIGPVDLRLTAPAGSALMRGDVASLFVSSLGIAMLVFSEGVVLARTVAARHDYPINPDRELVAFGLANAAAALVAGFAVGSSQTRTLLNDATGGRTQMVSLLAAGLTLAFAYVLGPWIATVPAVAIAAILVVSGVTFIDLGLYRRLWRMHRFSMAVAASTTLGVIALGVLPGILLGVVLSLLGVMAEIVRPHDALLGRLKDDETLHDIGDDDAAETIPGLVVYRFYGPIMFANVRYFLERIEWFLSQEAEPVRQIILDARAIPSIDITAADELRKFVERLPGRGIELVVVKAHLPLRETLEAMGGVLGHCRQFGQLADAVAAFQGGEAAASKPGDQPPDAQPPGK